jgi:dolichol-phosphate mannosyltransferase
MRSPTLATPLLALVVPVFNEAALIGSTLPQILERVRADVQERTPGARVMLLAIDDGSSDDTRGVLRDLARDNTDIRYAGFTRNFGKEAAILAGLHLAQERYDADVVVVIDCDLQHPPQLVGDMWARWCEGYRVVEAVKNKRGRESLSRRMAASLFYGAFSRASGLPLLQDTDFKLLDRSAVRGVLTLGERSRFFRGIVSWLGFESARVEFDVAPRFAGESGWSTTKLVRYAWRNITAFSSAPLRAVSILGVLGLLLGLALSIKALWDKLSGTALTGFSTVILLVIIFSSLILISLGIIGNYIALIYDEIKQRPSYVLRPED